MHRSHRRPRASLRGPGGLLGLFFQPVAAARRGPHRPRARLGGPKRLLGRHCFTRAAPRGHCRRRPQVRLGAPEGLPGGAGF